jgi:hypothetical protein
MAVQRSVNWCSAVQCSAVQCSSAGWSTEWSRGRRCSATTTAALDGWPCQPAPRPVQCSAVQCSAVQCSEALDGWSCQPAPRPANPAAPAREILALALDHPLQCSAVQCSAVQCSVVQPVRYWRWRWTILCTRVSRARDSTSCFTSSAAREPMLKSPPLSDPNFLLCNSSLCVTVT